jgi:hypothetical protein
VPNKVSVKVQGKPEFVWTGLAHERIHILLVLVIIAK